MEKVVPDTVVQVGNLRKVEVEVVRGVGPEELGIALMWACSTGQVRLLSSHQPQAEVVERLLQESSDLASQKFSLASCLMCACKNGYREVVALLVREEGVLLDITNKSGLSPEEVTTDPEIRALLRQEHWRRAKLEVSSGHPASLPRWAGRPRCWSSRRGGRWK